MRVTSPRCMVLNHVGNHPHLIRQRRVLCALVVPGINLLPFYTLCDSKHTCVHTYISFLHFIIYSIINLPCLYDRAIVRTVKGILHCPFPEAERDTVAPMWLQYKHREVLPHNTQDIPASMHYLALHSGLRLLTLPLLRQSSTAAHRKNHARHSESPSFLPVSAVSHCCCRGSPPSPTRRKLYLTRLLPESARMDTLYKRKHQ